jgi:hypothetical protein
MRLAPLAVCLCLPLFCICLPVSADGLSDLRSALQKLHGTESVKASLEYDYWRQTTEDKKPVVSQGKATAQIEDGIQGLRITWSRPLLEQAVQESKAQLQQPDRPTPTRTALRGVDVVDIAEDLNHAEALLRDLDQAQLQEEKTEAWQGHPAHLLVLKLSPRMPENQRKYLKELKVEAKVWVGADGLPLAFASSVSFKGSRFFISFEGASSQERQFAHIGGRLVAIRTTSEDRSAGMGMSSLNKKVTTLSLL